MRLGRRSCTRHQLELALRIEEIVTLTWPQVDWENREIRLMQKGGHYRTIPMTADIEAILRPPKKHHKMAVFTFVAKRTRKDGWGNAYERGKRYPVTYWGIQTARRRDFARAETGVVGFHDLRRTAAKRMDKAVGEEAAQKMLGHGSIKTTRTYQRKDTDVEARDAYVDAMRAKARGESESRRTGQARRPGRKGPAFEGDAQ